jgi:hypothetical protein
VKDENKAIVGLMSVSAFVIALFEGRTYYNKGGAIGWALLELAFTIAGGAVLFYLIFCIGTSVYNAVVTKKEKEKPNIWNWVQFILIFTLMAIILIALIYARGGDGPIEYFSDGRRMP